MVENYYCEFWESFQLLRRLSQTSQHELLKLLWTVSTDVCCAALVSAELIALASMWADRSTQLGQLTCPYMDH